LAWHARWNKSNQSFYAQHSQHVRWASGKQTIQTFSMHREIMGLGKDDPREVDHENGNTLDNRRSNLRASSFTAKPGSGQRGFK
jgi:hypothetical protein